MELTDETYILNFYVVFGYILTLCVVIGIPSLIATIIYFRIKFKDEEDDTNNKE